MRAEGSGRAGRVCVGTEGRLQASLLLGGRWHQLSRGGHAVTRRLRVARARGQRLLALAAGRRGLALELGDRGRRLEGGCGFKAPMAAVRRGLRLLRPSRWCRGPR